MSAQKANPRRATRRFLAAADMRVREDDLCDCSEGLCAGFDGCRSEFDDDMEYCADVDDYDRCFDCGGTGKCWACGGYNPCDDLGSGCSECDGWGNCWCGSGP